MPLSTTRPPKAVLSPSGRGPATPEGCEGVIDEPVIDLAAGSGGASRSGSHADQLMRRVARTVEQMNAEVAELREQAASVTERLGRLEAAASGRVDRLDRALSELESRLVAAGSDDLALTSGPLAALGRSLADLNARVSSVGDQIQSVGGELRRGDAAEQGRAEWVATALQELDVRLSGLVSHLADELAGLADDQSRAAIPAEAVEHLAGRLDRLERRLAADTLPASVQELCAAFERANGSLAELRKSVARPNLEPLVTRLERIETVTSAVEARLEPGFGEVVDKSESLFADVLQAFGSELDQAAELAAGDRARAEAVMAALEARVAAKLDSAMDTVARAGDATATVAGGLDHLRAAVVANFDRLRAAVVASTSESDEWRRSVLASLDLVAGREVPAVDLDPVMSGLADVRQQLEDSPVAATAERIEALHAAIAELTRCTADRLSALQATVAELAQATTDRIEAVAASVPRRQPAGRFRRRGGDSAPSPGDGEAPEASSEAPAVAIAALEPVLLSIREALNLQEDRDRRAAAVQEILTERQLGLERRLDQVGDQLVSIDLMLAELSTTRGRLAAPASAEAKVVRPRAVSPRAGGPKAAAPKGAGLKTAGPEAKPDNAKRRTAKATPTTPRTKKAAAAVRTRTGTRTVAVVGKTTTRRASRDA